MINDWGEFIKSEQKAPYYRDLTEFLNKERHLHVVYPAEKDLFTAFAMTPFNRVKIVIIGQDPYHEPGQANGMSFSVNKGTRIPRSLRNIFKEVASEYGTEPSENGDLTRWATQGVLLLNTVLTVTEHRTGSHSGKGWEIFTGSAIDELERNNNPIVYLLWGKHAQEMKNMTRNPNHLILTAAHPSPLSASRGFFGCGHFRKANEYLKLHGVTPINWVKEE